MPIPSNPPYLSNVLGYAADVNVIPGTTPSGSGAFSYQSAFPQITAIPLTAGGVAPMREDFNAVLNCSRSMCIFSSPAASTRGARLLTIWWGPTSWAVTARNTSPRKAAGQTCPAPPRSIPWGMIPAPGWRLLWRMAHLWPRRHPRGLCSLTA